VGTALFIDVNKSELPVFTAEHGRGAWEAEAIAGSSQVFFETQDDVRALLETEPTMERAMSNIIEKSHNSSANSGPSIWRKIRTNRHSQRFL
jgi:hypothetical protein